MCLLSTVFHKFGRCDGGHRGPWTPRPQPTRPFETTVTHLGVWRRGRWECPTKLREDRSLGAWPRGGSPPTQRGTQLLQRRDPRTTLPPPPHPPDRHRVSQRRNKRSRANDVNRRVGVLHLTAPLFLQFPLHPVGSGGGQDEQRGGVDVVAAVKVRHPRDEETDGRSQAELPPRDARNSSK